MHGLAVRSEHIEFLPKQKLYITVLYSTLNCTVLYCTVFVLVRILSNHSERITSPSIKKNDKVKADIN